MTIKWTKLGGSTGFIRQLPRGNNDYGLTSLVDGSSIVLTDLSRNVVMPAMSFNIAGGTVGGSTSVVARDYGYVLKLKTTALEVRKSPSATVGTAPDDELEMAGWVMMAEACAGTNSEVRVLDDISYSFLGTATTTTHTVDDDFSVASPVAAKVLYIPRGCWGENSTRFDGSAYLYPEIDPATAALTLTRGNTNQDTFGEGSRVWFQGSKWKVHRRAITGAEVTWQGGTPDGEPNYFEIDMYENANGATGGAVSNPTLGNLVYSKVWVKHPTASNSDTRKPINFAWDIAQGSAGKVRVIRPSDDSNLIEPADAQYMVEVLTHADLETEALSVLRGPDYHPSGTAHDGATIALLPSESFQAANDEIYVSMGGLTDQNSANATARSFFYSGVVNADSVEVRQPGNAPTANYLIGAFIQDWSGVETGGAGLPLFGASVDAWNGTITVSGEAHPGGTITAIEITGADDSVVTINAESGADATDATFNLTDQYFSGGEFEQLPWDTELDFVVLATAARSEVAQLSIPSPTTGQVQVAGADRTALTAGGATDSLLVKLFENTGFDTNQGSVFWNESGVLNEFGVPNTLTAGDAITVRRFESGWSSVYTQNDFEDAATGAADIDESYGTDAAGNITWQAPAVNVDGVQWTSDGSCRSAGTKGTPLPPPIPLSRIVWTSPVLNDDIIWSETIIASPTSSDMMCPGLVQADYAGYGVLLTGGIVVNRLDLVRFDADGNITGIDNTGSLPFFLASGVAIRLEYSNINGVLTIKVGGNVVLTKDDPTYQPIYGAVCARGLNTNSTCLMGFRARGRTPRSIVRLNDSAAAPSVSDGETLQILWSEIYNNASYTVTDERGNQQVHAATPAAPDRDQITLNLANLRHGNLTVAATSGETAEMIYPAPAGKTAVNLDGTGPLSAAGQNAQWQPDSQIRFGLSVENNVVQITRFGNMLVAGDFIANVDVEEHRSGAWLPAVRHTIFQGIDEDFTAIPDINLLNGQGHSLDLSDYYNLTTNLDPTIPGSSGTLSIAETGLAALGLALSGDVISGTVSAADGTYPVTIDVTDPAGNTQQAAFNYIVGAQGGGDTTPPELVTSSVTALSPTTLALTVTVEVTAVIFRLYAIAVATGAEAASEAQIKAGQDAQGNPAPSGVIHAAPPGSPVGVAIGGLMPATAYDLQVVIEDADSMVTLAVVLDNGGAGYTTLGLATGRGGGGRKRRRPKP